MYGLFKITLYHSHDCREHELIAVSDNKINLEDHYDKVSEDAPLFYGKEGDQKKVRNYSGDEYQYVIADVLEV